MASVTLFCYGIVQGNDGIPIPFGDPATPKVITLGTGIAFKRDASVAQNTTATLFNTTNDLSDFDCMIILSDQDVMLEFTTDLDNSVGDEVYTLELSAGVPLVLGDDVSYANYTVNFGAGTLDVIQRVRVRNLGATTANVTLLAGT
mgnify:CR=1 FL=1